MISIAKSNEPNSRSYDWEEFDSDSYVAENYNIISVPDRAILKFLVDCHKRYPLGGSMVEIGAGPNLYPLLAASVFRARIFITDISARNLQYLKCQINSEVLSGPWPNWVDALQELDEGYGRLEDNPNLLRERCTFEQLSIFDLPEEQFDFSSMHFVAESITSDFEEFVAGCDRAVQCLKPGGAFAASFMLSSQGYFTGNVEFPAVAVDAQQICKVLARQCTTLRHFVLEGPKHVIREGHSGILLVYGNR